MVSGYHTEVAQHYEKYPYPDYPLFALGAWRALDSVDCSKWGASRAIRDIWIAGSGTIAPLMFARRNFRSAILASDLSLSVLQVCAKRLRLFGIRNVILKQEDIFDARYEDAFDAVDSYGVIHHTISPPRALGILARSLRQGGLLRLMVYSSEARSKIEDLRRRLREKGSLDLSEAENLVRQEGILAEGDLAHPTGIADALLHPMVHVYTRESLAALFSEVPSLEVLRINDKSNFVIFARKK